MKIAIAFVALCICAAYGAEVLRSTQDVRIDGYNFNFELDDQTLRDESGNVVEEENMVNGKSEYTSPEGKRVVLTFKADSNGYHPTVTVT